MQVSKNRANTSSKPVRCLFFLLRRNQLKKVFPLLYQNLSSSVTRKKLRQGVNLQPSIASKPSKRVQCQILFLDLFPRPQKVWNHNSTKEQNLLVHQDIRANQIRQSRWGHLDDLVKHVLNLQHQVKEFQAPILNQLNFELRKCLILASHLFLG